MITSQPAGRAPIAGVQHCAVRAPQHCAAPLGPTCTHAPPAALQEGDTWGGATAVAVPVGTASEDIRYSKSQSLHLWLLGYEFTGRRWNTTGRGSRRLLQPGE